MRALIIVIVIAAGCSPRPRSTATRCPDPDPGTLTYDNFGRRFMRDYCLACHDSALKRSMRNGAPISHDFETLRGVLRTPERIDEQAAAGPDATNGFMPPVRCPGEPGGPLDRDCRLPTIEERRMLAEWLACERLRPHTF
jgi:hypothetical protein